MPYSNIRESTTDYELSSGSRYRQGNTCLYFTFSSSLELPGFDRYVTAPFSFIYDTPKVLSFASYNPENMNGKSFEVRLYKVE